MRDVFSTEHGIHASRQVRGFYHTFLPDRKQVYFSVQNVEKSDPDCPAAILSFNMEQRKLLLQAVLQLLIISEELVSQCV